MCPVTLPASWVASTKRCKDAGSVHSSSMDATEDAAARRVIAGQGAGERCRAGHSRRYLRRRDLVLDVEDEDRVAVRQRLEMRRERVLDGQRVDDRRLPRILRVG